jgi:hypothetical protein
MRPHFSALRLPQAPRADAAAQRDEMAPPHCHCPPRSPDLPLNTVEIDLPHVLTRTY